MRKVMSLVRLPAFVLATALTLIGVSGAPAGAAGTLSSAASAAVGRASHRAVATKAKPKRKHKKKKDKPKKAVGPSMSVLGFGVNRLFVANGKTVTSTSECSEMVGGQDGSPIGPPQQVFLQVYLRATSIPDDAPVEVQDSLPEGEEELELKTLSPYGTWSKAFGANKLDVGAPPGDQKDLFSTLIVSRLDEAGQYEGPSAEEFDGTYSFTASVEAGGHTLTSTATGTVDCPQLR
jgi:hypothetical protein